MKKQLLLFFILLPVLGFAQSQNKYIRKGNKQYENNDYQQAAELYQKALDKEKKSYKAKFNYANALYKQQKYRFATSKYEELLERQMDKNNKATIYYNLGNAYLKNSMKSDSLIKELQMRPPSIRSRIMIDSLYKVKDSLYEKSIESYKNALRNNPTDQDARYNLVFAKKLRQQSKKDQQKNQDKIEPSEFARKLKARADKLVAEFKFNEALDLMLSGMKKDKTIAAYRDFIKKLQDINKIQTN